MSLQIATILDRAAEIVEPPGAWSRDYVRDAAGRGVVNTLDPRAASFGMVDAIKLAVWQICGVESRCDIKIGRHPLVVETLRFVIEQIPNEGLLWNYSSGRRQDEVVAKIRQLSRAAAQDARAAG